MKSPVYFFPSIYIETDTTTDNIKMTAEQLFLQTANLRRGDESQALPSLWMFVVVFLSILRDLGGIEPGKIGPYRHEIAQRYMTL